MHNRSRTIMVTMLMSALTFAIANVAVTNANAQTGYDSLTDEEKKEYDAAVERFGSNLAKLSALVGDADMVLLSQKMKKGDGDYNDIVGQVKNIGDGTADFVKIGVTVYDKNGDVVGTDSTYADATTLEPNQKSSFNIFSSKDNFEEMESYELSLQWQDTDGTKEYVENAQPYKANSTMAK